MSYKSERIRYLPETLQDDTVYLVGNPDPWKASLLCPCGCGDVINLSLLDSDKPNRWKLITENPPTIAPAIERSACGLTSFVIHEGSVFSTQEELESFSSFWQDLEDRYRAL